MQHAKRVSHGISNEVNKLGDSPICKPTLMWEDPAATVVRAGELYNIEISMKYGIASLDTGKEFYSAIFKTEYVIAKDKIDVDNVGEIVSDFKHYAQAQIQDSPVIKENIDGSTVLPSIASDVPQNHLTMEILRKKEKL